LLKCTTIKKILILTGGGGAAIVLRHSLSEELRPLVEDKKLQFDRKVPRNTNLITGLGAVVIDTSFSPFCTELQHELLATASADGLVKLWKIPTAPPSGQEKSISCCPLPKDLTEAVFELKGHTKKTHLVQFHPTAADVLVSASYDNTVKLWDVNKGVEKQSLGQHGNTVQSVDFSSNGSHMVTACKDKLLRLYDPRVGTIVVSGEAHDGAKGFKANWLGAKDQFLTVRVVLACLACNIIFSRVFLLLINNC